MAEKTVTIKTPWHRESIKVGLIQDRYLMAVLDGRPLYAPVYDERVLNWFAAMLRERIEEHWNCNILITGEPGTGKSTLALKIALHHDPSFSLDSIVYTPEEFARRYQVQPPGGQIILDEAVWGMYASQWMDRVQEYLVKVLDVGRARLQISYFLIPYADHLLKKLRRDMMQYWIHVIAPYGRRGFAKVWVGDGDNQFSGKWWKPEFAMRFTPLDNALWKEYEKKKMSFLADATNTKKQLRGGKLLAKIVKTKRDRGMTIREIAQDLGIGSSTVHNILKATAALLESEFSDAESSDEQSEEE